MIIFRNQHSITATQRTFSRYFNMRNYPIKLIVCNIITRFRQKAFSVAYLPRTNIYTIEHLAQ